MKINIILIICLLTITKLTLNIKYHNKICLIVRFKNERHILYEFIQHYLLEEIDTIFLIDDNSDDDYMDYHKQWLLPLISSKKVIIKKSLKNQIYDYNNYVREFINYRWILICDMDEFFFSVPNGSTLKSILNTKYSDIDYILVPWKLFSHNSKNQPKSVIDNNVRTHSKLMDSVSVMAGSKGNKYIVRPSVVKYFKVHCCLFNNKVKKMIFNNCHNNIIENNHYKTQSKEFLLGVKASRGGGKISSNKNDNLVSKKKYINYKNHIKFRYNKKCYKLKIKRYLLIKDILMRNQIKPKSFYYKTFDDYFNNRFKVIKFIGNNHICIKKLLHIYNNLLGNEILLLICDSETIIDTTLSDKNNLYVIPETQFAITHLYDESGINLINI